MNAWSLGLVTAAITGWATAIAMLGPLLVDMARDLNVSVGQAGLLGGVTSLPWALGAPATGLLSDRLGRRPLMVLALAGVGVASIGASLTPDFGTLVVMRLLAGAFGAFGPASTMAAIGDLVPTSRRGSAMGWLNLGFGLAAIGGVPAVGLVAGLLGWRAAFVGVGVVLIVLAFVVQAWFPSPARTAQATSLGATYKGVFSVPWLGNVLSANLLERSIFNAVALYLPAFLMLSYGLNPAQVAPALAVVAVGTIGGTVAGGWLSDRLPRAAIFVVAQASAAIVALVLFGLTPGLLVSILVGGLFTLTNSSSRPAFLALGSELSPRSRGALLGVVSLSNQAGVVLGSSLGALAISLGGYKWLALVTLVGGLGAALLALPLSLRRSR